VDFGLTEGIALIILESAMMHTVVNGGTDNK